MASPQYSSEHLFQDILMIPATETEKLRLWATIHLNAAKLQYQVQLLVWMHSHVWNIKGAVRSCTKTSRGGVKKKKKKSLITSVYVNQVHQVRWSYDGTEKQNSPRRCEPSGQAPDRCGHHSQAHKNTGLYRSTDCSKTSFFGNKRDGSWIIIKNCVSLSKEIQSMKIQGESRTIRSIWNYSESICTQFFFHSRNSVT